MVEEQTNGKFIEKIREFIWAEGRASLCEDVPRFSPSRPSDRNRMQVMRNSCLTLILLTCRIW